MTAILTEDGSVSHRLWKEARRSLLAVLGLLFALGGCLLAFLWSLPALQVSLQRCPAPRT